jgi:hypothetical protein
MVSGIKFLGNSLNNKIFPEHYEKTGFNAPMFGVELDCRVC